ncbi:hypothetical protein WISP_103707 [Willisornis vidua]|uniref:Uncharacterized protein n=1 Tax=Willisornis vidua TaxID=1566151 RepID=A0ABQ9CXL4_9PASS|nr:hypothetical protein WISP_103707 [Willisornis vidua]
MKALDSTDIVTQEALRAYDNPAAKDICRDHLESLVLQFFMILEGRELSVHPYLAIASCAIAGHHREDPGSILLTPSLQILIDIDVVSSHLSLLESEQAQLIQYFLIREMLQPINHCFGFHWTHSMSSMSLVLKSQELDTTLQMQSP